MFTLWHQFGMRSMDLLAQCWLELIPFHSMIPGNEWCYQSKASRLWIQCYRAGAVHRNQEQSAGSSASSPFNTRYLTSRVGPLWQGSESVSHNLDIVCFSVLILPTWLTLHTEWTFGRRSHGMRGTRAWMWISTKLVNMVNGEASQSHHITASFSKNLVSVILDCPLLACERIDVNERMTIFCTVPI